MYNKNRHIHFMGIGGIGMSGIAHVLHMQGYTVSGCDVSAHPKNIAHLTDSCRIDTSHDPNHTENIDVLVYSSAIDAAHPEIKAAQERGIPVISRAIMLAELMRMKYGIAVSGSHGKTTTTSLISHILLTAGHDPTVIVGGILKNLSSHSYLGQGDLLIAEADESDRSLLYLNPSLAIVTNIDAEHLDTYADLADVQDTFKNFLARLPFYGKAIVCIDDPGVASILPLPHVPTIKYGLTADADLHGANTQLEATHSTFDVILNRPLGMHAAKHLGTITLNMPGTHNVYNALAATALCLELGLSFTDIALALSQFKGVERRFEFKGTYNNAELFDDYGHHPTEIMHTVNAAQRRVKKRLFIAFQPHRYSRTQRLWKEFVELFGSYRDHTVCITDIYPASEHPIPDITTQNLVADIARHYPNNTIVHTPTYEDLETYLRKHLAPGDLLLTIGAGKINTVAEQLIGQTTDSTPTHPHPSPEQ